MTNFQFPLTLYTLVFKGVSSDIFQSENFANIGENDFNVKLNRLKEFLSDGHKVKIRLWFKGREIVHRQLGEELVAKIIEKVSEFGELDNEPKFEGRNLTLVVLPKKTKVVKKLNGNSKDKIQ